MLACAWEWGHPGNECPYVFTEYQCLGCKEVKQLSLFSDIANDIQSMNNQMESDYRTNLAEETLRINMQSQSITQNAMQELQIQEARQIANDTNRKRAIALWG